MKELILNSLRYFRAFGLVQGLRIFVALNILKSSKTTVPNINAVIHLRPDTSDLAVFHQVFVIEEYKLDYKFSPKVIIDAGANVGFASVYFKNIFPTATIIAIEPDRENFEALLKNTQEYENIHCINAGVWSEKTNVKVVDKFNAGKWAMTLEESADSRTDDFTSITIDEIMNQYNFSQIDLIKIDIETSEKNLFSQNYSNWLGKTKMIIIELHDRLSDGCAQSFFTSIVKTFENVSFIQYGENSSVINENLINQ